jgi:hypothetical protein
MILMAACEGAALTPSTFNLRKVRRPSAKKTDRQCIEEVCFPLKPKTTS